MLDVFQFKFHLDPVMIFTARKVKGERYKVSWEPICTDFEYNFTMYEDYEVEDAIEAGDWILI